MKLFFILQFFVFIVEHADEPIFVDPTPSNRQTFIIYVGVEFMVEFCARPTSPDPNRFPYFSFLIQLCSVYYAIDDEDDLQVPIK